MTPVAPYRARTEKNGFLFPLCRFERLFTPGVPVNFLMDGFPEIRRFFGCQPVCDEYASLNFSRRKFNVF
jgi:hypothetical protein